MQRGPTSTAGVKMSAHKAWASAIFSAVLAFLSSIATAIGGAEIGFDSITFGQWLTVVIAGLFRAEQADVIRPAELKSETRNERVVDWISDRSRMLSHTGLHAAQHRRTREPRRATCSPPVPGDFRNDAFAAGPGGARRLVSPRAAIIDLTAALAVPIKERMVRDARNSFDFVDESSARRAAREATTRPSRRPTSVSGRRGTSTSRCSRVTRSTRVGCRSK
jgi:hypothetical protein